MHVNPWLIHVNVWQKPIQYCKVISLQLIKINGIKKNKNLGTPPPKKKNKISLMPIVLWLILLMNASTPNCEIVN